MIKTTLRTFNSLLLFHPWILFHTFSLINLNTHFFHLPISDNKPRYLLSLTSLVTPKIEHICSYKITDFLKFIACPYSFSRRRDLILVISSWLALKNKKLSSAKDEWVITGACKIIWQPWIWLFQVALEKAFEIFSKHKKR